LPVSPEYDTCEEAGEGLVGGAGRFVGVEVPPFDGIAAADFGGVAAEFGRAAAPARSPPLGGGGDPVTAAYPLLQAA
jgi:hypothetical protein